MNSSAKNILLLLNIAINKHVQVFVNEVDWEQILKRHKSKVFVA